MHFLDLIHALLRHIANNPVSNTFYNAMDRNNQFNQQQYNQDPNYQRGMFNNQLRNNMYPPDITYNPNPNTNIPYSTHNPGQAQRMTPYRRGGLMGKLPY